MTLRELSAIPKGWIESPGYDLGLLALTPLLGIVLSAVAFAVDQHALSAVTLFALGMPHYLSTYTFFLGDENRAYYRTRAAAFYLGPVLVVGFLTLALVAHLYFLVAIVVDTWNVFHVSRQSSGILSVYRHLGGGDNRLEKLPANLALVCGSAGLYAIHIDKQPSFHYYLGFLPFPAARFLGPALLLGAAAALGLLAVRMVRRARRPAASEWIFLAASLALFLPYLILETRSTATSAMLSGHYVQYLGLIWLLNHRRYKSAEGGSAAQRWLAGVSGRTWHILVFLGVLVLATSVTDRIVHRVHAEAFHTWILNVIVLLHFYLDGLFWAFKRPFVRESVGPYLAAPERRLAAA